MSRSLALASALSVMLMAGYTLFGDATLRMPLAGEMSLEVPAEAKLPGLPALPGLPGLR